MINRRTALTVLGLGAVLAAIGRWTMNSSTQKMPVLFLGHGSPMNALVTDSVTHKMAELGETLPVPKAILMISAHWMTKGTWVTSMLNPKTIHDFYGFPPELFAVQYPAQGHPETAKKVSQLVTDPKIGLDESEWGLDHGTWSVLKHMYPQANIPVVQLSLDMTQPPEVHFELGKKLRALREQGVLIMGSGNIVHNLRRISWDTNAKSFDWALEFDAWAKKQAMERNFKALVSESTKSEAGKLSIPTPDHYYPLLYVLGAADSKDELVFDIEDMQNASISMRSFRFG